MPPFDAILLGLVEGITEFLPISSTGHLILAIALLHVTETDFVKTFEIVIQFGSILAVVVFYFREFFDIELLKKLFVAFLPTAVIGLTLYKFVKTYLIGNMDVVLGSLFIGGVLLILFERLWTKEIQTASVEEISYRQAFLIGLAQSVALIPGVSRSGATILAGLSLGVSREAIVKFSFLLAVPTMIAATGYDFLKSSAGVSSGDLLTLFIGTFVAFLVALVAIRFLLAFIRRNNSLTAFGIYRIALALSFFLIR